MRVAALYDIHGNLPALEATLDEVRRSDVDLVVVGGDVMPGPMPIECLASLRELDLPTRSIFGNGEREVLAELAGEETGNVPERFREVVRWVARRLPPDDARAVASWPATLAVEVPPLGKVLFCHGTPRSDTEIFTRRTPEERLAPIFDGVDAAVVVCGHTHMQFDRTLGAVRVVNAGSVGMPFGAPGAHWLLLGPDVELRRTFYDRDLAAARIRDTSYPQAEEFAAGNVLRVPSEEQVLEAFARSETG
jgi:putative phosphoesterase